MKRIIVLIASILLISLTLTSCGNKMYIFEDITQGCDFDKLKAKVGEPDLDSNLVEKGGDSYVFNNVSAFGKDNCFLFVKTENNRVLYYSCEIANANQDLSYDEYSKIYDTLVKKYGEPELEEGSPNIYFWYKNIPFKEYRLDRFEEGSMVSFSAY